MPILVTVDLVEVVTLLVLSFFFGGVLIFTLFYVSLPGSAKNIWKNRWLKRGKRCLLNILNDDNVCGIVIGRPRAWGIRVSRKLMFLVPRSIADTINKRAIQDGFPYYEVSTRTGLAASPEFIQLAGEVVNHKVKISSVNVDDQKPEFCWNERCASNTDRDTKFKLLKKKAGDSLTWICDSCKAVYRSVEFLNPHVIAGITKQSYDPSLIQGIEQDTREEAMYERPSWFIWLLLGLIPYALITALVILTQ